MVDCCFWSIESSIDGSARVYLHRTSFGGKGSVLSKLKERSVVFEGKGIKGEGDGSMVAGCGSSILVGLNRELLRDGEVL